MKTNDQNQPKPQGVTGDRVAPRTDKQAGTVRTGDTMGTVRKATHGPGDNLGKK